MEYVTAEEYSEHKSPSKITASVSKPTQKKQARNAQKCCGQQDHGDYLTQKKECQEFGKNCKKCAQIHHYSVVVHLCTQRDV